MSDRDEPEARARFLLTTLLPQMKSRDEALDNLYYLKPEMSPLDSLGAATYIVRSSLTQLRDEMRHEAGIVRSRSELPIGSAEKSWVIIKLKRWADTLDEILSGQGRHERGNH